MIVARIGTTRLHKHEAIVLRRVLVKALAACKLDACERATARKVSRACEGATTVRVW